MTHRAKISLDSWAGLSYIGSAVHITSIFLNFPLPIARVMWTATGGFSFLDGLCQMSENVGYIGLWREIRSHWIWEEDRPRTRLDAWIDIICEVRFSDEPKKVIIKDQIIMCHYGESLNSLETWAKRWGWNKSKVRRFFQLLEKEQQIVTVNETVTTRLTVCNYEKFDPKNKRPTQQVKRK